MFDGGATIDRQNFPKQCQVTLTLTLRLHVRRQPSLGHRQCETKTPESGNIISLFNCIHNAGSCARLCRWPNCRNRMYAMSLLVQSFMPRVPPGSCTSRIPKQHSLDPPVRRQIRKISQHASQICSDVKRHCSDQIFHPFCCASATALPFQWCIISCQGAFHSTKFGGPTIIHSIWQKQRPVCTSHFDFFFDFAPVCNGAATHLGHRGWDLTNIYYKCINVT